MNTTSGITIWLTGLSSAGKTTIARALEKELVAAGNRVEVLDGDEIRTILGNTLGFSKDDRNENIRRIAHIASLLTKHGVTTIVSAISPYRAARNEAREKIGRFIEVYVNAPIEICESRDVKGLYKKARSGEIAQFTGIDDPYESPLSPEVECLTGQESVRESVSKIIAFIKQLY
ncbi:MAG TPA: adenylyl-sulfate kinase [Candidatus Kapabacteria bacterium]|nr:adenylyl-sulfate kinase [Candidatus Kapabacteria bacterium]